MYRWPGSLFLFALLLAAGGGVAAEAVTLDELRERIDPPERYVYKTAGDSELLIKCYRPRREAGPAPAVLLIHGGGWRQGSPEQLALHARYLAGRGIVAMTVGYRLVDPDRGTRIADALGDVRDALGWVRAHAGALQVDPGRIALLGESAGGHLAAAVAISAEAEAAPAAALLWNPVLDLTDLGWIGEDHPGLAPGPGAEADWETRAKALSPQAHVRAGLPPTLLIHGRRDEVVPVEQAQRFAAAMEEAGNRITFHEPRAWGHAFAIPGSGSEKQLVKTLEQTDRFLGELGWVRGAPTLEVAWAPEKYRDRFTDAERAHPHVTPRSFTLYDWPYLDGQWEGIVVDEAGHVWFSVSTHDDRHHAQVFRYDPEADRVAHVGGLGQAVEEKLDKGATQDKIHSRMFQRGDAIIAGTTDGGGHGEIGGQTGYQGGHWLRIDRETGAMSSLGKSITGDGLICVEYDPYNDLFYGHTNHHGRLVRFDPETGEERDLGFPYQGLDRRWPRGLTFMIPPSGRVYGFRPPDCSVWEYDPATDKIRVLEARPPIPASVKEDPEARKTYRDMSAHMTLWNEEDRCFYFIRSYDEALCRFVPPAEGRPAEITVVRKTLRPEGLERLWGNRPASTTLVIHDRTVWYVSPTGWAGVAHLVSYHLDTGAYTDHGPMVAEGNRRIAECHSLAAGPDGTLYAVAFVYSKEGTPDPVRRNARRGAPIHPRFLVIDPAHDLAPGTASEPARLAPR